MTHPSNVIRLADHRRTTTPDGGLNSPQLSSAGLFIERSNIVQAPIDIGVALFWLFYMAVALTGFGIASWAVCLVVIRSLGL